MAKKDSVAWQLPKDEVAWSGFGFASTRRRKRSTASRAVDLRGWEMTLVHLPTGLSVSGEIPKGHYSKKQMQREREDLWARLWPELEDLVARHLRLPGW